MLQLKIRGPKELISLSVEEESNLESLLELIAEKLKLEEDSFDLLAGFPPKAVEANEETLIKDLFQNNETIRIQLKELSGQQAQGTPKKKGKAPKISKEASKKTTQPSSSSSSFGFGAKVVTIQSKDKPTSSVGHIISKNPKTTSSSSTKRVRSRIRKSSTVKSSGSGEADLSEQLITAVSGGTGTINKVLRKVFHDAVSHQYNSTKSISRLHAVYSGNYHIQEVIGQRILGTGESKSIDITFHRGLGARTSFEERVDLLSDDILLELLKLPLQDTDEYGKEVLKPMNLSKCSPRIFWSLVYKYGPNLQETIKTLLKPWDDCHWLTERKRELSEKAKMNLQQQLEKEAMRPPNKKQKKDNNIVTNLQETSSENTLEAIDLTKSKESKEKDEAKEHILVKKIFSSFLQQEIDIFWSKITFEGCIPSQCYQAFSTFLSSTNLLDLASFQYNRHHEFLQQEIQQHLDLYSTLQHISEEQYQCWIDNAQERILYLFWHRLCGGGSELLRYSLAKLRIRTPKEILVWKNACEGLYEGLINLSPRLLTTHFQWNYAKKSSQKLVTNEVDIPESRTQEPLHGLQLQDIQYMILLSQEMLNTFPWIKQYNQIIEDDEQESIDLHSNEETPEIWEGETWLWEDNEYLGQYCLIRVREDGDVREDEDNDNNDKRIKFDFWEEGQVVAYLPETSEDPAIWRIKLFPAKEQQEKELNKFKGRFEDLEIHELQYALQSYQTMISFNQ